MFDVCPHAEAEGASRPASSLGYTSRLTESQLTYLRNITSSTFRLPVGSKTNALLACDTWQACGCRSVGTRTHIRRRDQDAPIWDTASVSMRPLTCIAPRGCTASRTRRMKCDLAFSLGKRRLGGDHHGLFCHHGCQSLYTHETPHGARARIFPHCLLRASRYVSDGRLLVGLLAVPVGRARAT